MAALVLGVASATYFTSVELPQAHRWISQAGAEVQQYFPPDLVLNWTGQELLSNTTQPQTIYYPSFIEAQSYDLPERLAFYSPVVTTPQAVIEQLSLSSLAVITPSTLFLTDFQGGWSDLPLNTLTNIAPTQIDAQSIPEIVVTLQNAARQVLEISQWLLFGLFPISIATTRLISAILDGLLAYILIRLQNYRFTYGQVLKLSLLITMIASSAEFIAQLMYRPLTIPIFSIVYWSYLVVIILAARWRISELQRPQEENQRR